MRRSTRKDADGNTFTGLVNISAWVAVDGGLTDERVTLISKGKRIKMVVESGRLTQTDEVILQLVVLGLRA